MKSDGRLTVRSLAVEAGVSRATANRAPVLLATFRDAVRKSECGRFAVASDKGRIRGLETRLATSKADARYSVVALQTTIDTMAQHIMVLTIQLQEQKQLIERLRAEIARRQDSSIIPIHSKSERRP